jgi:hypothetical protein
VRLARTDPLVSVLEAIVTGSRLEGVQTDDPCPHSDGKGAHRVAFTLRPDKESAADAIDQLLNGESGLRSRYVVDPTLGETANHLVCDGIAFDILGDRIRFGPADEDKRSDLMAKVRASLVLPSAKVWYGDEIDQTGTDELFRDGSIEWATPPPPESEYHRLAQELALDVARVEYLVRRGRAAPKPQSLTLKGAYVWDDGRTFVVPPKRTRSLQLHLLRWT